MVKHYSIEFKHHIIRRRKQAEKKRSYCVKLTHVQSDYQKLKEKLATDSAEFLAESEKLYPVLNVSLANREIDSFTTVWCLTFGLVSPRLESDI